MSGEKREKTEWHNVVIFSEGLCRVAEQYLRKGSKVYLEGQLQTRKWQTQDGQDRYTTEVVLQNFNSQMVLLDKPGGGAGAGAGGGGMQEDDYPSYTPPTGDSGGGRQPRQAGVRQENGGRDPVLGGADRRWA